MTEREKKTRKFGYMSAKRLGVIRSWDQTKKEKRPEPENQTSLANLRREKRAFEPKPREMDERTFKKRTCSCQSAGFFASRR